MWATLDIQAPKGETFADNASSVGARRRVNRYRHPVITTKSLVRRVSGRHDASVPSTERNHTRNHGARNQNGLLDDVSKAIIEQLQEDGRRPYATIGQAVGLSEAAVRQRVHRLIKAGVMQIVAVTDPLQVGFHRQAMIGLRVEGDLQGVADEIAKMPEVDYVVITAGSFDLLVEVVVEDDEHLYELLNSKIRTIPAVRSTESFVYLKLRKQTYTWGTR
jgi:Lrp/AsnC family transcriptional regulator for asnA, asnC and gidA